MPETCRGPFPAARVPASQFSPSAGSPIGAHPGAAGMEKIFFHFLLAFLGGLALTSFTQLQFHKWRLQMKAFVENDLVPRKEWAAPKLKKVDVEQITAASNGSPTDGVLNGPS
jgi:hypothetical protein